MKKLIALLTVFTVFTQSSLMVFADDEIPAEEPQETAQEEVQENQSAADEEQREVTEEDRDIEVVQSVITDLRTEKELPVFTFDKELDSLVEDNKDNLQVLEEQYTVCEFETETIDYDHIYELFKESEFILSEDVLNLGIGVFADDVGTYNICIVYLKPVETANSDESHEYNNNNNDASDPESSVEDIDDSVDYVPVDNPKEAEQLISENEETDEIINPEEITGTVAQTENITEDSNSVNQRRAVALFSAYSVDGFIVSEGSTYYVDPKTHTYKKGEALIDGYHYYFDDVTGEMVTGWREIPDQNKLVYYNEEGHMVYGKQTIDGDTYYFNEVTGVMEGDQKKIDGYYYYFDETTGKMITGWKEIAKQNKTVYYDEEGHMLYGKQTIDGDTYYFNVWTGAMEVDQKKIDGYYYYFDETTGKMITGWKEIAKQNKTVYYDEEGHMLYEKQTIDGDTYYFNKWTGAREGDQKKIDGYYYYFDETTGKMITGWKEIAKQNKTVYYDEEGHMLYEKQTIDGDTYYFNKWTGAREVDQKKIDGYYYYFDETTGKMITGWKEIAKQNKTVYYNEEGHMLYGKQTIDDDTYYFNVWTGAREVDQKKIDGYYYYFDETTGKMITGWKDIPKQNKRVYYNEEGHMLYGKQVIDGETYYFDKWTGALLLDGFREINSNGRNIKVYYKDGEIVKKSFKLDQVYYQVDSNTGAIIHEQRLFSNAIYMEGIDISEHNGNIDLSQYQNGFVIIRIGWWTNPDTKAVRNMDLCDKYNIPYGVYLYDYTTDPEDAVKEAEFTLSMIQGRNIRCGVWFDMEDDGWRARNGVPPSHPNISKLCQAYCTRIEQAGYHVGIYASYSWFENYITGCDRWDKWVAHWGSNNGNWNTNLSGYAPMHQYTSVPLDKNVMYVDPSYFR